MSSLLNWLDHRTGYRDLLKGALYERIPGGPRWRYVWGSTLTFALFVQFVTGLVLWAAYSANAQGAWESVYYIQNEMQGGWLLRGVHHYTAQVTIVLLVLHLMQVVIDGANLFHEGELPSMHEMLDEAFDLIGDSIRLAHAKDLEKDGDAGHQAAGTGVLDYEHYLALLQQIGFDGSVILHSLDESQVATSAAYVRERMG